MVAPRLKKRKNSWIPLAAAAVAVAVLYFLGEVPAPAQASRACPVYPAPYTNYNKNNPPRNTVFPYIPTYLLPPLPPAVVNNTLTRQFDYSYCEPPNQATNLPIEFWTYLNGSRIAQQKLGSLTIGSASQPAALCLNSNLALGDRDPVNCITNWTDIQKNLPRYLHLQPPLGANSADVGYIALQAVPTFTAGYQPTEGGGGPGGGRGNTQQKTIIYSLIAAGNGQSVNQSGGLYATVNSDTGYAGFFAGKVDIESSNAYAGKLCLPVLDAGENPTFDNKGNPVLDCITRWSQAVSKPSDVINLQAAKPYVNDQGSGAVNGTLVGHSSIVLGAPAAAADTKFCGDQICSPEIGEEITTSPTYCPSDCQ